MNNIVIDSAKLLPFSFAKEHRVLLLPNHDNYQVLYCGQLKTSTLLELTRILGGEVVYTACDAETFQQELTAVYQAQSDEAMAAVLGLEDEMDLQAAAQALDDKTDLLENDDDAPIIRLINALLSQAIKEKASDIHVETYEQDVVVRFRIDGVLREVLKPKRTLAPLIISRIKVMSKLDISEKRLPQDGRISLVLGDNPVDVRVSTIPTRHGERIVMRLLDKTSGRFNLNELGMQPDMLQTMTSMIKKPHGIILVTGPTGSGKTTSLYACLSDLNKVSHNILTVEDPIEYEMAGIGQTQVNTKSGMTFAKGLRAILRQDPDIVMVGEIRDLETAEIAVQASLTGHLVLSTLHTNTGLGAITRLHDMGVERFLIASSVVGLVAQRLVRRLCPACSAPVRPTSIQRGLLGLKEDESNDVYIRKPVGCELCQHSGYQGRMGLYEVIDIDDSLRQMIHDGCDELTMSKQVFQHTRSIGSEGRRLILSGETSIDEVLRVTTLAER